MNNRTQKLPLSDRELVLYSILITAIVIGSLMRINQVFIRHPLDDLHWDMGYWYNRAFDIKGEQDLEALLHPPAFQIFLSTVMRIAGPNRFLIGMTMAALSVVTPWLWYRWLREITRDKTISLIGYAIFTFLPSQFLVFSYFMDSVLLLPLSAAALWLTWRAARKATWSSCVIAAIFSGLACLTKMIVIPYVVLPWCYTGSKIAQRAPRKHAIKMVAASLVIIASIWSLGPLRIWTHTGAIVVAPDTKYLQRCYESGAKQVEVDHYFDRKGIGTFVEGAVWSCSSMGCMPFYPFSQWQSDRKGQTKIEIDYRHGCDDAKPIAVNWSDRLKYTGENIIFFFFEQHWPEDFGEQAEKFPFNLITMVRFIWLPLAIFTVAMILRQHRREFLGWYFIAVTLIGLLQQVGIMEGRYMKVWQGIALVTVIYVIGRSKQYQLWREQLREQVPQQLPNADPGSERDLAVDHATSTS